MRLAKSKQNDSTLLTFVRNYFGGGPKEFSKSSVMATRPESERNRVPVPVNRVLFIRGDSSFTHVSSFQWNQSSFVWSNT